MNSYWEQDAMLDADCIVIGGGLIGLQTALEWRAAHPADRVVVLERGFLPLGASTRNAGFACFGSLTELMADIDTVGIEATVDLVAQRWRGLARLRERLPDAAIGYETLGGYELLTASQLPALDYLPEVNRGLRPLFGADVFVVDPEGLRQRGFGAAIHALVTNRFEGQLHSGKLLRALALLAASRNIELHTGCAVEAIEEGAADVVLRLVCGPERIVQHCRAARVALCTNALAPALAPQVGIEPARGQVLVTAPIPGLTWRGCHHFDEGYYYFRDVGGDRILLGGARNRDFQGERTTDFGVSEPVQSALETMLEKIILPGRRVGIAHRWSGLMGFTVDKQPIVRRLSPHVALGFGCNGMGVALGAEIAARTAALLE